MIYPRTGWPEMRTRKHTGRSVEQTEQTLDALTITLDGHNLQGASL